MIDDVLISASFFTNMSYESVPRSNVTIYGFTFEPVKIRISSDFNGLLQFTSITFLQMLLGVYVIYFKILEL